jgi:aerobic-type carbon monoxide dehydrogenase small subunit (CoxS/CutS family)
VTAQRQAVFARYHDVEDDEIRRTLLQEAPQFLRIPRDGDAIAVFAQIAAEQAKRSCVVSVGDIDGQAVTTIEGLGANGPHPLQSAWLEVDVAQCGYCQSGQIMQAAALLAAVPKPTDQDIDEAMSGNLCRCGTYQRVRQAIKLAAGGARP